METFYLESMSQDPFFNLALEEHLFNTLGMGEDCFLLWQNENTVVVGRYQNTEEEICASFVREHDVRVARRLSGGGAVYHDLGNLNYTIITDKGAVPDFDFSVFVRPVVDVLRALGADAAFGGRNDITIGGAKISGTAQAVRHGRVLHHGCILLDSNLEMVSGALRTHPEKYASRSIKSVRSRVTTVNAALEEPVSVEEFKALLRGRMLRDGKLTPRALTEDDLADVERLRRSRYDTWEWNYGGSPPFQARKEKKFPAGLVTALLDVERGRVRSVRFFGDFFGGELEELEARLVGLPLSPELPALLEAAEVGRYIHGLTGRQLAELLLS